MDRELTHDELTRTWIRRQPVVFHEGAWKNDPTVLPLAPIILATAIECLKQTFPAYTRDEIGISLLDGRCFVSCNVIFTMKVAS